MSEAGCVFCEGAGGEVLWRDARLRIVLADEPDHPGFVRVIWNAHVREMTDLPGGDRDHCMRAVFAAESALRALLRPDKVNLACLGNVVPHIHWHVVPRFRDDARFPNVVWGPRVRDARRHLPGGFREALARLLAASLAGSP
jgi:diadenosine tetraphosphate (Ap4A) HIT family hydrolase